MMMTLGVKRQKAEEDPRHVWITVGENERRHQNWELYTSIDWEKFEQKVQEILHTEPENSTSSSSGSITGGGGSQKYRKLLLMEGHIILNHEYNNYPLIITSHLSSDDHVFHHMMRNMIIING